MNLFTRRFLRSWSHQLTIAAISAALWTCTDHRLRPLSSSQVRLKTTNNINTGGFPGRTEYTYDQNNRVSSFTRSDGTRGVFLYDEQNRYLQFDFLLNASTPNAGERTRFSYPPTGNTVNAVTYQTSNRNETSFLQSTAYELDADKRLISSVRGSGPTVVDITYQYSGGNITSERIVSNRVTNTVLYEFDDKPNPYYGLIAPDVSEIRRFSRNNITRITTVGGAVTQYAYTYDNRGLPSKVTVTNSTGETVYTYESY